MPAKVSVIFSESYDTKQWNKMGTLAPRLGSEDGGCER